MRISKDMEEGFPGEVEISSWYLVSKCDQMLMAYEAKLLTTQESDDPPVKTPIGVTNHTYWNLSGDFQ